MSLWIVADALLSTLRISLPTVVDSVRGVLDQDRCDGRLDWWSRHLLEVARIDLSIEWRAQPPPDESFVVMSNHQSLYDIPVVFQTLRRRVRMVAKKELFRVPVWGSAMRRSGFIEVDRSNREVAIESMKRAERHIAAGTNVWVAPEGTRSRSGALGPFKKGGFYLAVGSGARVLPLSIDGTRHTLPARGWQVQPGARVRVVVHPPIASAAYGEPRIEELMGAVRAAIESGLVG